jgi:transcriptional regulator with XRE-family HTH domain
VSSVRDARPFAAELERYRKAQHLSPAQLARAIGASTSQVSRWRAGGGISYSHLQLVADWMQRPIEDLLSLAGFPVRMGNVSSAPDTNDPRLHAITVLWRNLQEDRRSIIHEIALAGASSDVTHSQAAAAIPTEPPRVTAVREAAGRGHFTGRDLADLLGRLPDADPSFEVDLAQIRNEWRVVPLRDPWQSWESSSTAQS